MIQEQNKKPWELCKKTRYSSAKWALWDLDRISEVSDRDKKPIRPYLCHLCGAWHLTSEEYNPKKV